MFIFVVVTANDKGISKWSHFNLNAIWQCLSRLIELWQLLIYERLSRYRGQVVSGIAGTMLSIKHTVTVYCYIQTEKHLTVFILVILNTKYRP